MQVTRLIPCLDVKDGRVVKGVQFLDLVDAGDPVDLAAAYAQEGADEITFLDITASSDERATMLDVVERTADVVFVPLTVGGGIRSVDDARMLLRCGAEKIGINSAAVADPGLVRNIADEFGAQCVVVAIDARRRGDRFEVVTHGGRTATALDARDWAAEVASLGAGEILLTSMDRDGTREGFDHELDRAITSTVGIPVIASGGVGTLQDLVDGVVEGGVDAVLAASIFHSGEFSIREAKTFMAGHGLTVRPA